MNSLGRRSISLGDLDPAGSRHLGRRSAVHLADESIVAGTANGRVRTLDRTLEPHWVSAPGGGSVVSICSFEGTILVGERGPAGAVRSFDAATGEWLWRYETADDVGDPQKETRFFLPFVVDAVAADGQAYVAARRYERRGDGRVFQSVVYAFGPDGTVDWRYETDASPIGLDVRDDRVAVGFNRCPGEHQCGLVVLDRQGDVQFTWDPGTEGQRRVGDVGLLADGAAVASHGDYCGYRLDERGGERWRVPLATPAAVDGETVYAYPNHVHATASGVAFVTGNTYPVKGRQTDARHPNEHTALGLSPEGEERWSTDVGGFATGIGTSDDLLVVPGAQHFRDRDVTAHGLGVFDLEDGQVATVPADGVMSAAAIDGDLVAGVEEPVAYHDDDAVHGSYRLWMEQLE